MGSLRRRSAQQATACSIRAPARFGGVVRGAEEGLNHGGTPRLYSIGFAGGSYPACRLTALLQAGYTVRDNIRGYAKRGLTNAAKGSNASAAPSAPASAGGEPRGVRSGGGT